MNIFLSWVIRPYRWVLYTNIETRIRTRESDCRTEKNSLMVVQVTATAEGIGKRGWLYQCGELQLNNTRWILTGEGGGPEQAVGRKVRRRTTDE